MMYDAVAQSCLTAFKNFHEMIIDILLHDDGTTEIVYCKEFFALLKENMGYYKLIEKPLQTLIKRIEETSINAEYNCYTVHSNGYSNSREFCSDGHQHEPLMQRKHVSREIRIECTDNYSGVHVSRDRNETSNANDLFAERNELSLIETQLTGECRYRNEDSPPTDGRFIASQNHEDRINGQEIDELPHGITRESDESVQQSSETIQERYHNFDADYNCHHEHQYVDGLLSDSNYKLVMEAIVQLENDNNIDRQQAYVQSTDITTSIDSQIITPVREDLDTVATDHNVNIVQIDTPASQEPANAKRSCTKETSEIPLCCNEIANKTDLTKHSGNEEPTTVRKTRSSVKRKRSKKIPIRQPKVILTDLIHTIGKDKLIEYRSISSKKQPATAQSVQSKKKRQSLKHTDASEPNCKGGFWKKKFPYGSEKS